MPHVGLLGSLFPYQRKFFLLHVCCGTYISEWHHSEAEKADTMVYSMMKSLQTALLHKKSLIKARRCRSNAPRSGALQRVR